jgi:hypothetical protein
VAACAAVAQELSNITPNCGKEGFVCNWPFSRELRRSVLTFCVLPPQLVYIFHVSCFPAGFARSCPASFLPVHVLANDFALDPRYAAAAQGRQIAIVLQVGFFVLPTDWKASHF